jgi:glutaredoxin
VDSGQLTSGEKIVSTTPKIEIYGHATCAYCKAAMRFLDGKKLNYIYYEAKLDDEKREEMLRVGKGRTYPQIIINGTAIGGYDDMMALDQSGELTILLTKQGDIIHD